MPRITDARAGGTSAGGGLFGNENGSRGKRKALERL